MPKHLFRTMTLAAQRVAHRVCVGWLFFVLVPATASSQEIIREPEPFCTQFVARAASLVEAGGLTASFTNHGTVSAPGNDSTDIRWRGLGYGYEFGLFAAAEVPGKGDRGLAVPKRYADGAIMRDINGDTVWVRHIVSEGLLSHGGERSPDRTQWWGWQPVECAEWQPSRSATCFPDAPVDHTVAMNDLRNREFAYYPLQGDSTWQGLGLRVETRVVQSADPALRDVVFLIYRIENRSRVDLDNLVVGMWGDPHIGGARNYQDDLARFLPDADLVEVWDADGIADTPGLVPGYFGFQFLEGPTGLSSMTTRPFNDLSAANDEQIWELVRPGRFDRIPTRPGDDVFLFGSGAVKLRVGMSVQFGVALLLAESREQLEGKSLAARQVYDEQCKLPPRPDPFLLPSSPIEPRRVHPDTSSIIIPNPLTLAPPCDPVWGCALPPPPVSPDSMCYPEPGPALDPFVVTPSRIRESLMDAPASVSVVSGERFLEDAGRSPAATLRHTLGVDIAQVDANRYQVATRGFNQSLAGNNLLLVDYRQSAVPGLGFNSYALLPVASIDIAQAEVVRGGASGLYGSRADHGAIQFLTKEPLDYPGTSFSAAGGEGNFVQGQIRHAQKLNERFAYKVVGSYARSDDWFFDGGDADELANNVANRTDDATDGFVRGTLQYRHVPCGCLTFTANVDYAGMKQNLLHETGEMFLDYRLATGQLKVESDRFQAQTYYMKGDTREGFDYRTGLPIVDDSKLFAVQARYKWLFADVGRLVVGFDLDRSESDTGGQLSLFTPAQASQSFRDAFLRKSSNAGLPDYPVHLGRHGRNEADDAVDNLGVYFQSRTRLVEKLELRVSGRLDFSNVIDTQFSPKFGLAYRPNSSHAFRLSIGRGFARPTNIQLFADFPVAGSFPPVRAAGNLNGWTFDTVPLTTSLLEVEGLAARDNGLGIDLGRAFQVATDSLFAPGGYLEGWDALQTFLDERAAAVDGFSEGVLTYDPEGTAQVATTTRTLPALKPMETRSIEIGYKGNFQQRTFVGIDVFYARTKNHISGLRSITPFVLVPGLTDDMTEEIFRRFTDDELARYKLSRNDLAWLINSVLERVGTRPVGIVEPVEGYDVSRGPEQILSWTNYGKADYFGVDLEFRRIVNDELSFFSNLSWLSDNYFNADALEEADYGYELALNAPRFKIAGGFDYLYRQTLRTSVAARYVDSFKVRSGVHRGEVGDYFLLDLGLGINADYVAPGLRVDVMAENVFDHEHREWVDVAPVGRRVTLRATFTVQ